MNDSKKNYQIVDILDSKSVPIRKIQDSHELRLIELSHMDEVKDNFLLKDYPFLAYKSKAYFQKRFFEHPIYEYQNYGIILREQLVGILFTRKVYVEADSIIRIVDFVGDIQCLTT